MEYEKRTGIGRCAILDKVAVNPTIGRGKEVTGIAWVK